MNVARVPIHVTSRVSMAAPLSADVLQALLPADWPRECPLARVRTCGTLTVEVAQELQPGPDGTLQVIYGPPEASLLSMKGMTTALLLLALLASQPDGLATKDFLAQTLPHPHRSTSMQEEEEDDWDQDRALSRLDNVVVLLRKLLCPPCLQAFAGITALRKHLVRFVRATPESGSGYQLAPSPLVWLDVEAMETYVSYARQLEARGEEGLEVWQTVSEMGMRGPFLGHERYSEWADWRRGRVAELLWQSVEAQWKRAVRWGESKSGREAASRLLLAFWQTQVTHEDAFRSLVELLGKQGRFHLAEECYRQLCAALEREGKQPQPRTQETMTFLRRTQEYQAQPQLPAVSSHALPSSEQAVSLEEGQVQNMPPEPLAPETRHLIGREGWLNGMLEMMQSFPPKKLIVLQGPIGVGKSSELMRLAEALQGAEHPGMRVIWLPLPLAGWSGGPEAALDLLLATLLSRWGQAPFPAEAPRERLITAWLAHLEQDARSTVILLDNAECLLDANGSLSACWEAFLTQLVRSRHQACLLLATNEWHGWPGRESLFVAELMVPALSPEESVHLLHRLGLSAIPTELLHTAATRLAGLPLLLEWTVKLVTDPLLLDTWEGVEEREALLPGAPTPESMAQRLQHLLDDASLLGTHLASRLSPLLQRIVDQHLSPEARLVLERLSVVSIPLGKPALQLLCPRPRLLKELRDASLLVAYPNRIQLLPMVAATVGQMLSSQQRYDMEEGAIAALMGWLDEGQVRDGEAGNLVAELMVLLLRHRRLQDAAQVLLYHGWLGYKFGHGPRLALMAQEILRGIDWDTIDEQACASLILRHHLFPFLGKPVSMKHSLTYQRLRERFLAGEMALQVALEQSIANLFLSDAMNRLHFEEAERMVDAYSSRLAARQPDRLDAHPALLAMQALLLGRWCEHLEEQGERQQAESVREQAITLYRQRIALCVSVEGEMPLNRDLRLQGLGHYLSHLGYHLNRAGQYEEALQIIEQAITLQEQGYVYIGVLAASYGEKSQILMALGRFQDALRFDEKAVTEIHRCADAGDATSQEEIPIYLVNRGKLYLRLGKVKEAEQLLQEALPHISAQRRKYRMFAHQALEEIKQWRQQARGAQHQLDWRWVERFRELVAYDSFWWLTWAGPFTEEEQRAWDRLFALPLDETTRAQLAVLMKGSRERELQAALEEQRLPRLHYPAIALDDVRRRIKGLRHLAEDVQQQEPHPIVRRLYLEAIQEDVDFLRLIEATSEGNTEQFWECNRQVFPAPTIEDMHDALAGVHHLIRQGWADPMTAALSQRLQEWLQARLECSTDWKHEEGADGELSAAKTVTTASQPEQKLSVQAAKRFFETILHESGYEEWQVVIDPNATGARLEQGLHVLFLPDQPLTLSQIKHLLIHEIVGHAARSMAGEQSLLGLLGIHTRNYMPTEEGLALYQERQEGQHVTEGIQWSALAVGLACGVMTPPQTFLSLFSFFESLTLLHGLLLWPSVERQKIEAHMRRYAQDYALSLCLRVYRGVPDLRHLGVCFLQDAMYLRGLRLINQAVAEDETVLDRLAVGMCALEQLPDLQELGIVAPPHSLRLLVTVSDLDNYILSFHESEKQRDEEASD